MAEKLDKICSVRTDEETLARFKEISSKYDNASECLQALINAHEMDNAKQILIGQKTSIEDFQSRVDGIVRAYISSLDLTANTEERVRKEFAEQLEAKERTIQLLQKEISELKNKVSRYDELSASNASLREYVNSAETSVTALKQSVSDKQKVIDNLLERLPEQEQIEDLKIQLARSKENEQQLKLEIQKTELKVKEEYLQKIEKLQEKLETLQFKYNMRDE